MIAENCECCLHARNVVNESPDNVGLSHSPNVNNKAPDNVSRSHVQNVTFVSDNAADIQKAFKTCKYQWLECAAHHTNLIT